MTLSSIMTLSIAIKNDTLQHNDPHHDNKKHDTQQHNDTQHNSEEHDTQQHNDTYNN
jgi:hypothetical protein